MRALCDPVQREALHLRWQGICNALVARAELGGIDATDITFTGTPLRLDIGSWCSVVLVEGATTPTVMIRSTPPGRGVLTAGLEGDDGDVAEDICDAIGALRRRRTRILDHDRVAVEAELHEMVTSTGWICDGVGGRKPVTALFRDDLDRVRGRLIRTDRAEGDPAQARFAINVEIGSLSYAQALALMMGLSGIVARSQPVSTLCDEEHDGPASVLV